MGATVTWKPIRMQAGVGTSDKGAHDGGGGGGGTGVGRTLLRVPLFYKILVANALILSAVLAAAGWLTLGARNGDVGLFLLLFGGGLVVSVVINAVILRLALLPLQSLQRTAEQVQGGDLGARVEASELADPDLERLMETFNTILESGDVYRRRLRDNGAAGAERDGGGAEAHRPGAARRDGADAGGAAGPAEGCAGAEDAEVRTSCWSGSARSWARRRRRSGGSPRG
jgi:hypothetical protein